MESDLRFGGRWAMRGIGVGGKPFSVVGEYRNIERPRLLVFTWLPGWQEGATESLVRFELEEKDGVTTVRLTHSGLTSEGVRAHQGWPQILTWLQAYAEGCRPPPVSWWGWPPVCAAPVSPERSTWIGGHGTEP